jgi:hypothetical protein
MERNYQINTKFRLFSGHIAQEFRGTGMKFG